MKEMFTLLEEEKVVAIIRGIPDGSGEQTAKALVAGGISFLEITLNTNGALSMIDELKGKFGEKMRIGAGTVLNLKMAKEAIHAGAEYLISPNLDEEVLAYGLEQGV